MIKGEDDTKKIGVDPMDVDISSLTIGKSVSNQNKINKPPVPDFKINTLNSAPFMHYGPLTVYNNSTNNSTTINGNVNRRNRKRNFNTGGMTNIFGPLIKRRRYNR